MDIIISNSSNDPIYLQIVKQIKGMIMSGELKEGDPLPSMRNMALQLRISLITTKRAYEELERDGFIESYTGKGSFVKAQNTDFIREENRRRAEEYLAKAVDAAKPAGIAFEELTEILKLLYEADGT
ncbi:MAG: GntR family transcriptional regulator [Lachnospiraceae bacterium]|nr:GntR family transcriptional regulator [Lachnospiraceae bacterium]